MPNWAYNNVTFAHADKAMIDRIENSVKTGILQELIPCPQELVDTVSGFFGRDTPEQAALEAQQATNKAKYGYETWYDYCTEEWGTKWDLCDVKVISRTDNSINIYFETAWSPPIQAFEKLLDLGFSVRALYNEEQNIWAGIWENGVDTFYQYDGADEAYECLPSELDKAFNIVANLEERETDEDDEDNE